MADIYTNRIGQRGKQQGARAGASHALHAVGFVLAFGFACALVLGLV